MKICANEECKNTIGLEADGFCYRCGSPMIKLDFNCECGKELSSVDKFCPRCGKKVEHRAKN